MIHKATEINDEVYAQAIEAIMNDGLEGFKKVMEVLFNEAMKIERGRYLRASPYERTADRKDYANGYKPRQLKTKVGALNLQIPQVREGDYYPSFLEKGLRSDRALKATFAEMYIKGVSTRSVSDVIEKMCGFQVTSTEVSRATKLLDDEFEGWRNRSLGSYEYLFLDARYENVRHCGQSLDLAVLVATGINKEGKREVLGISVKLTEAEIHWRSFLESLQKRGLIGVKLITSDAHTGLEEARKAVFPSIPWQRCQFHLQQNAQSHIPKRAMKEEVARDIRHVFNAIDKAEADKLLKDLVAKYGETAPNLSNWMEKAIPQGLTVFNFPEAYRKKLRTNNMSERLNKEIKRRTRKVGIFPNEASCLRLATAIVIEISDEWLVGKRYLPAIE